MAYISRGMSRGRGGGATSFVSALLLFFCFWAVSTNGIEVSLGGGTLTPERFLVVPLWFFVFFALLRFDLRLQGKGGVLLALWLSLSLISSLLSPVPDWSLKMWFAQFIASSYFVFVHVFRVDALRVLTSRAFLSMSVVYGILSCLIYFYGLSGGQGMDVWLQEGGGGLRLRGLITEANIFGVYLVLPILSLVATRAYWGRWYFPLLVGLLGAMILSFSRAPWISFLVALAVYFFLIGSQRVTIRRLGRFMFVSFFGLILLVLGGWLLSDFISESELVGRTNTIDARLVMWELAADDIAGSPVLGTGVFSFSEMHPNAPSEVGSDTYRSAWISNLFLAIFHDTGGLGFVVFFVFYGYLVVRGWVAIRRAATGVLAGSVHVKVGAALVASTVAFLVSGQSIPAHSLAFFWVTLALMDRQTNLLTRQLREVKRKLI